MALSTLEPSRPQARHSVCSHCGRSTDSLHPTRVEIGLSVLAGLVLALMLVHLNIEILNQLTVQASKAEALVSEIDSILKDLDCTQFSSCQNRRRDRSALDAHSTTFPVGTEVLAPQVSLSTQQYAVDSESSVAISQGVPSSAIIGPSSTSTTDIRERCVNRRFTGGAGVRLR
jgi:hypothetical protein